jgi:hypothetical protein
MNVGRIATATIVVQGVRWIPEMQMWLAMSCTSTCERPGYLAPSITAGS